MRHDHPMTNDETPATGPAAAKAAARARIRARRTARPEADRIAAAEAIARSAGTLLPGRSSSVSCYVSMPSEPGTGPLLAALLAADHRVVVPRIRGRSLDWVRLDGSSTLRPGPMGIREPVGAALDDVLLDTLAVMLIPGLAVDRAGRRLGQGGGYYDRALAAVPTADEGGPLLVAVLFDEEILDAVPVEPHDRRVHAAVTPGGVTRFG
jgi:5-formyltetrahydrofolate cyclo-ligase